MTDMFLNPPQPGVTVEESLLMGGRHTAVRMHAGVTYVTTIVITRLDPVPPLYQITHVAFRESLPGVREYLVEKTESIDDYDFALIALTATHLANYEGAVSD